MCAQAMATLLPMSGRKWEYAVVRCYRDPGESTGVVKSWFYGPGQTAWAELDGSNTCALLNTYGTEGWELMGPPETQNAVFTYHASNDTWHDRAYWVERTFWLKREVS